ncbi:hypothetical protein ACP70R_044802 [Stipagrostis hirtigluma subsp. patula]
MDELLARAFLLVMSAWCALVGRSYKPPDGEGASPPVSLVVEYMAIAATFFAGVLVVQLRVAAPPNNAGGDAPPDRVLFVAATVAATVSMVAASVSLHT